MLAMCKTRPEAGGVEIRRLVYGGKVDLRPVISHTIPLREGLRAFALIERGEAAKVLVTP